MRRGSSGSSVTASRSDHSHDSTAARAARRRSSAASPSTGITSPGRRSEEPRPLVVVANGEGEWEVGVAEIDDAPEAFVVHVPGVLIVQGADWFRRPALGCGEVERDAGRPDLYQAHRRTRSAALQHAESEQPVGRLEGLQRRHAVEALQQGGGVDRALREHKRCIERIVEGRGAEAAPRSAGESGTGQRADAENEQFGKMIGTTRGQPLRPVRAMGAGIGILGKLQPPTLAQVVWIDEALRRGHPAPSVEHGDGRPLRAVAKM